MGLSMCSCWAVCRVEADARFVSGQPLVNHAYAACPPDTVCLMHDGPQHPPHEITCHVAKDTLCYHRGISCHGSTGLPTAGAAPPYCHKPLARRTAGVVKRVAGLLVAGVVLGTVLFYVGLKLAFPDYT